jgi:hypothetical protein
MSTRIFVVSENNIQAYEEDIILWYYANAPKDCEDLYIGDIIIGKTGPECNKTIENIENNKKLENLSKIIIGPSKEVVFSKNQLDLLEEETNLAEKLGLSLQEDVDIIKTGIKIAKEKNLYLRCEHN